MENINHTTPAPGTTVRIVYVAQDGKVTDRRVFITRATQTHWYGIDLAKNEPRCFRREGLALAERIEP